MKGVLLIGGTGQLGQHLLKDAASFGFEIFSYPKAEFDITQPQTVREKLDKLRPEVLINTAAFHVVAECEENFSEAMKVNAVGVANMAKLCRKLGIKFVT